MSGARAKRTPKAGASGAEDGVPSPDERGSSGIVINQYRFDYLLYFKIPKRPEYRTNLGCRYYWQYNRASTSCKGKSQFLLIL